MFGDVTAKLPSLLEVGEPLVDDPGDAGVERIQLFVLGGHGGGGRLRGEYAHQTGEEGVEVADNLTVGGREGGREGSREGGREGGRGISYSKVT